MEPKKEDYLWSFQIKDVVNFEGTEISVYSDTHDAAIRKVKSLKLPQLKTFDDIEDSIRLTSVFEVREDIKDEHDGEVIETGRDDDED
jgi:hypothetical protein